MSIATGPAVELTRTDNTYSGGTYILDTALRSPVTARWRGARAAYQRHLHLRMAMLRARPPLRRHASPQPRIRVCDGGLTFFGDTGSQAGRVCSTWPATSAARVFW
jgi:hypothetical protein